MSERGKYQKFQDERYNEDSKEIYKPFAEVLNTLMEEQGVTNEALAAAVGKSKSQISKYLSAKSFPDIEALDAIQKYFGVSFDYLLGASDIRSPNPDIHSAMKLLRLSEQAVKNLINMRYNYLHMSDTNIITLDESGVLDELLESSFFFTFLTRLVFVRKAADKSNSVLEDEEAAADIDELIESEDALRYQCYTAVEEVQNLLDELYCTDKILYKLRENKKAYYAGIAQSSHDAE